MATQTGIEWTDTTWNPVTGCTRASAGCDHCYAVKMTARLEAMGQVEKYGGLTVLNAKGERHFNGVVRTHDDALTIPLKWRKPQRVFVNSMSDLFHRDVPFAFIDKVFAVMALTPQHTYQVLTKRPERMAEYLRSKMPVDRFVSLLKSLPAKFNSLTVPPGNWITNGQWSLSNAWLGTSIENADAMHRVDALRDIPAAVRFLSCEPLIGPLTGLNLTGIDWVIVGGESGADARACNLEWIRDIGSRCKADGVPVFVKQIGANPEWRDDRDAEHFRENGSKKGGDPSEWPADLRVREFPQAGVA